MTTRRVTFNINNFLEDLHMAIEDRPDLIHDTVDRYTTFLNRAKDDIKKSVVSYVNRHVLVSGNQEVKSYIDCCHGSIFEK